MNEQQTTMSNTNHTPGPWKIDATLEGQTCITVKDHPSNAQPIVCRIFNSSHIHLSEQYFNAHLIASAPELLDALRTLVQMSGNTGQIEQFLNTTARELVAKATAA